MKTTDYNSMNSVQQANWNAGRKRARYDSAQKAKFSNWQTEHKAYGEPMPKKRDDNLHGKEIL